MTDFAKSGAPYGRLPEEEDSQDQPNPFKNYTHQQPYIGAEPGAAKLAQQMHQTQQIQQIPQTQQIQQVQQIQPPQPSPNQIIVMVGDSPQQVAIPPGFALVPGPNGQLMLQPYPAIPYAGVPYAMPPYSVPMQQTRPSSLSDLDDGWFAAYKVWLIIMMVSCCGGGIFWMVNSIASGSGGLAALVIPIGFFFYSLFLEYQALTQKDLRKAKLAFIFFSILQILQIIGYIVTIVNARRWEAETINTAFWPWIVGYNLTIYWGAYQVRKVLDTHTRVQPAIVMA